MSTIAAGSAGVRRVEAGQALRWADEMRDLVRFRTLLSELVRRDLTIRYKRSVFGVLWTMLHPLLLMLIFHVVFSGLFQRDLPRYETYFLPAYIAWMFFSQTVTTGMASVAWNGPLMKRMRVPRSIFTLSTVISGVVNLVLALLILFALMFAVGAPFRPSLAVLPLSLLILALFTFGVSLALMSISVFFADVREMVQAGLPALLYLTPVIYPLSIVPERFRWIVAANPLTLFVDLVRAPIYHGRLPAPEELATALVYTFAALATGWLVFRRLAPRFEGRL